MAARQGAGVEKTKGRATAWRSLLLWECRLESRKRPRRTQETRNATKVRTIRMGEKRRRRSGEERMCLANGNMIAKAATRTTVRVLVGEFIQASLLHNNKFF